MRFPARALLALVAAIPVLVPLAPTQAATTGRVQFAGTVTLPQFPCSNCWASFNSTFAEGTVQTDAGPLVVTGLHADFNYSEMCTNGQALQGAASGTATLSGVGSPLSVEFEWARTGTVAVIAGTPTMVGTALFLPTGGLPACTGGSITASIVGSALFQPQPGGEPPTVPAECEDGIDNDLDGRTDYGSDPGCSWSDDTTENSDTPPPPGSCTDVAGNPVCVQVEAGTVYQNVAATSAPTASHHVVGAVDIYEFDLPTGGTASVPCVVLIVNATTVNPCAEQEGWRLVRRDTTLVDRTESQPGPSTTGTPLARVCNAQVTVTVRGIGINDFPAYTLC